MIRKPLYLLVASLLLVGSSPEEVFAQKEKYRNKANDPVEKLGYEKKLRWADGLFKEGSYYNAVEYYGQLQNEQPRNPYIAYQIAESNFYLRDYGPAASGYNYAYSLAKAIYPEAKYKEGIMLKMNGDYKSAIVAFNQFITDNPKTYKKLKKDALREIEGCKVGENSMNDPKPASVTNVGPNVNTAYTESAPRPLGDSALLFSTMHSNVVVDKNKEKRSDYVSRFMVSQKNKFIEGNNDTLSWPLPFLDGQFNDSKSHVSNGVFSDGGDRFYFTKCSETDSNTMNCKIFVSEFENTKWTFPKELGDDINLDGSSSTHPYIAKVGKKEILFFSSDRKLQSRGGYDIWYSVYDSRLKSYRRPQNVGKQINTNGDEQTPYFDSRENKLYFSSNGQVTMGGFDVFGAEMSGSSPSKYVSVQNLGYPVNSPADELYYVKDPLGKDAYVVSNRPGSIALKNPTCCDDIWRVKYDPKLMALGEVRDQRTQQLVSNVVVKMVDDNGNLKTYNSTDGKFEFSTPRGNSYTVTADKKGFTSTSANINTEYVKRTDEDKTYAVTIFVDSFGIDSRFRMDNVFYDYNKATLRPESISDLNALGKLMKDNPSINVEILSYTDSKGTADYNLKLSQERAQSVVNYLVSDLNISKSRLSAKGMGMINPAAPNQIDGKDNAENRQLNRRTEFRIMKDDESRRIIFDSSKPGTIGSQEKNLTIPEQADDDLTGDNESQTGRPGSRVNR